MARVKIKKASKNTADAVKVRPVHPHNKHPVEHLKQYQFQKGQSGNPSGGTSDSRPKLIFWRYVVDYLAKTHPQLNALERTDALTMAQLGAKVFVEKFAEGHLPRQLEVLNREIGPPVTKALTSPDEQAALAREYLRQMLASVPETETVPIKEERSSK
jgi:hypothetical protein